jgi:amino acid adenylation domain-containing protein
VQSAVRIAGQLDRRRLHAAVESVVADNEILRTTFGGPDGAPPLQFVSGRVEVPIGFCDLSPLSPPERREELERVCRRELTAPFDFERGPLLRVSLVALSAETHTLLLTLPALCADAFTLNLLAEEIARLYRVGAPDAGVRPESLPYADLSEWQNELLEAEETGIGREYWRKHRVPLTSKETLPFGRLFRAGAKFAPQQTTLTVEREVLARIEDVVRGLGCSTHAFILACWQILLWRSTLQPEIAVGTLFDGRSYEEVKRQLGPLAKYLPLRSHIDGALSFAALAKRNEDLLREYGEWQEYFDVGQNLDAAYAGDRKHLLPFCFDYHELPADVPADPSFSTSHRYICTDAFGLKLSCLRGGGLIAFQLYYDSQTFSAEDVNLLAGRFLKLIGGAAVAPEAGVGELEPMPDGERRLLLLDFNNTDAHFRHDDNLHRLFETQAERGPERVALVMGDDSMTYGELNRRSNQVAHYLRRSGVGADSRVGLCIERSFEFVIGLLGILKAGGAYVPLDPDYPRERLSYMSEDAGVSLLLTEKRRLVSPPVDASAVHLDVESESIGRESVGNPAVDIDGDNLACVIYTSGSTGNPKGVMLTHRAICNHVLWRQEVYSLTENDRFLHKAPSSFDISMWEVMGALAVGARLILAVPGGQRDGAYLARLIAEQRITVAHFPPVMLRAFLEEDGVENCRSLRRVFCGGEILSGELRDNFFRRLDATLHNQYGPSEATIDVTIHDCERAADTQEVPIGRPIANVRIYILDSRLNPVPVGVPGELHVGGVSLARGYINSVGLTAEKFIPDPFGPSAGARLYKSGDFARYLPDGSIEFLGRRDHQVKIRGVRVELGEIESALRRHAGVSAAVAVVQEDVPGNPRLVAYVVPEGRWAGASKQDGVQDGGLKPDEVIQGLREHLRESLPSHMVPSSFVLLESLPLMPNGKVDRGALPRAGSVQAGLTKVYVRPRCPLEETLADIWAGVLNLPRVGIDDNFFESGGNSILSVRLVAQAKRAGLHLSLLQLFQHQTIRSLAEALYAERPAGALNRGRDPEGSGAGNDTREPTAENSLVCIKAGDPGRPFFCVHPVSGNVACYVDLAYRLGPQQSFYAFQARGISQNQTPLTTITEMALHYLKELRAVQPEGPYLLGGWSMGGVVAFEMAQHLIAQGQKVSLLALFDSVLLSDEDKAASPDDLILLERFLSELLATTDAAKSTFSVEELLDLAADEGVRHIIRQARRTQILPQNIRLAEMQRLIDVCRANSNALRQYQPKACASPMALFSADENSGGGKSSRFLHWRQYATGDLNVIPIPGDHFTILSHPNVKTLAHRLQEFLDRYTP